MINITIRDYFNLSEILKTKEKKDFQKYQDEVDYHYNKEKKVEELYKFYQRIKNQGSLSFTFFEQLNDVRKIILIVVFLVTFLVTYNCFDTEINVKTYILFSIILPLFYSFFTLIKIILYKYPQKNEPSWLNNLFKKISSTFENKHNHVLKTYSIVILVEIGISYAVGILLATTIIFWSHSITFYSESSYSVSSHIEQTEIKKDRVIVSKSYWSKLITLCIFFMIVLKIILRCFATKILYRTINNSLEEQAKLFFDVMGTNTIIYQNSNNKKQNSVDTTKTHTDIKNRFLSTYYKLYYEMELDESKYIEFYDEDLKDKAFKEYSFALFDKEEDDEKILSSLENLVLLFTSPESLADETFRICIKEMLQKNSSLEIWVLPLIQKENKYLLSRKGDIKYLDWKEKIEKMINDDRVSLYYEK